MAQLLLGIAPGEEKSWLFLPHVTSVPVWKLNQLLLIQLVLQEVCRFLGMGRGPCSPHFQVSLHISAQGHFLRLWLRYQMPPPEAAPCIQNNCCSLMLSELGCGRGIFQSWPWILSWDVVRI